MSIAPKIDEIREVLGNLNVDLGCFVETWLQKHIPDQIVAAAGYNLIRRDRCVGQHGGVCAYVRKTIKYHVLENLFNVSFKVLWLTLRPSWLPRGITNVIVGIVYHPPSADDPLMIHYLYESLTSIESQFPNSGTILLGDFNKLKVSRNKNAFNLKQIIKFPTCGGNILDLVMTDLDKFCDNPRKLSPFGLSDHDTIMVQTRVCSHDPNVSFHTKSRDLRPTKRLALRQYLEEVNVEELVNNQILCNDKVKTLELIINTGLDAIAPIKKKIIITNEPSWMSLSLKRLIHSCQKAFTQGDPIKFRCLRNQVNRERKRLRAKYYDAKVKQLRSCAPAIWWKEIKRLCGMSEQVGRREDTAAILSNIENNLDSSSLSLDDLANEINQEFLRPMSDINPLLPSNQQADADRRSEGLCVFGIFRL